MFALVVVEMYYFRMSQLREPGQFCLAELTPSSILDIMVQ